MSFPSVPFLDFSFLFTIYLPRRYNGFSTSLSSLYISVPFNMLQN